MKVIDYVMEQADIYDGRNVSYEQDIINRVVNTFIGFRRRILHIPTIYPVRNKTTMTIFMTKMEDMMSQCTNAMYKILDEYIPRYVEISHDQMDNLIEIGNETQQKLDRQSIHEYKSPIDRDTIQFLRDHAFSEVSGMGDNIVQRARTMLSELLLKDDLSYQSLQSGLQDVMKIGEDRAYTIAQHELSMAYNYGMNERINVYNYSHTNKMKKYWYGFKFSDNTCTHCRPKIGMVFDADDNSEVLPNHVKCRCMWLPFMDGWDKEIYNTERTDGIYEPTEIFQRLNSRLNISYSHYLDKNDANRYLNGDRSNAIVGKLNDARNKFVQDTKTNFGISSKSASSSMSYEYGIQMKFWKDYIARAIADNDIDALRGSYAAVQGMMVLPWDVNQMANFTKLLNIIKSKI